MQTNEQLLSAIENYLAQTEFPAEPELLYAPIGYSLAGGGKRLRPMLLMLSNGIFTDKIQHALPAAAASRCSITSRCCTTTSWTMQPCGAANPRSTPSGDRTWRSSRVTPC